MHRAFTKTVSRFWGMTLAGTVLATALSLVGIWGCSSQPTGPDPSLPDMASAIAAVQSLDSTVAANANVAAAPGQSVLNLNLVTTAYDIEPISDKGCTLKLNFDGDTAIFIVPAGAVDRKKFPNARNIEIRGYRTRTILGDIYLYDCGPSGLKFSRPIELRQPMRSRLPVARLLYFNELLDIWQLIDVSDILKGRTTFQIDHFSKYGVS